MQDRLEDVKRRTPYGSRIRVTRPGKFYNRVGYAGAATISREGYIRVMVQLDDKNEGWGREKFWFLSTDIAPEFG